MPAFTLWEAVKATIKIVPEIIILLVGINILLLPWIKKKILKQFIAIISLICLWINIAQVIYLNKCGEWINILALENINYLYLLMDWQYWLALGILLAFSVIYFKLLIINNFVLNKPAKTILTVFVCLCLLATIYDNIYPHIINPQYSKIFRFGRATPVVNFVENAVDVVFPQNIGDVSAEPYMFQKNQTYENELPLKINSVKQPNIIVIFSEGTSARLLGCYGGNYSNLTPNIDEFATKSTLVDNYYNHTAATFKGLLGQMTSCYPIARWTQSSGEWGSTVNYSAIPKVINDEYDTTFISPHETDRKLFNCLGFKNIITRDSILSSNQQLLLYHESINDSDMYDELIKTISSKQTTTPFFIGMYTFDTHANLDAPTGEKKYSNGNSPVLNRFHYMDASFGKFWQWFKNSPYKDNTIVIFTADHAAYYEKSYMELMANDESYQKYFIDRIPLIIYDPIHNMPKTFDANDATSLDLAPTIMQLIAMKNKQNAFMGTAIFDNGEHMHIHAEGNAFWFIDKNKIYEEKNLPVGVNEEFMTGKKKIFDFYENEMRNQIWDYK